MTLVIQVALGIVLAFLILAYLRQILAVGVGLFLLSVVALGGTCLWANRDTALDVGISLAVMAGVALAAIGAILTLQAGGSKLGRWLRGYKQRRAKPFERAITPKMRKTRTKLGYDD